MVTIQKKETKREKQKERNQVIWYLWQIRTAVKYIQILRQHTTLKEKKHQVLFATTKKLNKKHTHFLKEAFLLLFFKSSPSRIFKGISYLHFVFVSVRLFRHFICFFCTRIYHLKQASQALVNVTDMFSLLVFDLKNRASWID